MICSVNPDETEKIGDVFNKFAGIDHEFSKTHIPISLADFSSDGLVSRSQAKRVMNRVNRFKEVLLDFSGVESIGPSFADEVFRVWKNSHPEVNITAIHANDQVLAMISKAHNVS